MSLLIAEKKQLWDMGYYHTREFSDFSKGLLFVPPNERD
jgi:hypothetical protein